MSERGAGLKIGDRLWRFDSNRRVYGSDENGSARGGPIFAEHFVAVQIVAETKQSWIVGPPGSPPPDDPKKMPWNYDRVRKSALTAASRGFGVTPFYTDARKADAIWLAENRRRIMDAVTRSYDVALLRRIAALIDEGTTQETEA